MKRFKNKKLATVIIAFLMVFVVAGGFAALQRAIYLNARVNLYAPMVELVWASTTVGETSDDHPLAWEPGAVAWPLPTGTRIGIGHPGIFRYAVRSADWPVPHPDSLTAPIQFVGRHVDYRSAWWRLDHAGTDQTTAGKFPSLANINNRDVRQPREYTDLELNMIFDNFNQQYTFTVTMGNPGDIPLITLTPEVISSFLEGAIPSFPAPVNIVDPANPTVDELEAVSQRNDFIAANIGPIAARAIVGDDTVIDGIVADLAGITIAPGSVSAPVDLVFEAPVDRWMDFFETEWGVAFLDGHFANHVQASVTVRVPATLP